MVEPVAAHVIQVFFAALFRDMPVDVGVFDDHSRWQEIVEKMPRSLQLQIRKGKSHLDAKELYNACRTDLRYRLIPDPKLGRRPAVRINLATQDNRVMSARITSVVRLALLSIRHLENQKSAHV